MQRRFSIAEVRMMSLRRSTPLLVSALALAAGLTGAAVRPLLAHHVVVVEGSLVYEENGASATTRAARAAAKARSRDAAVRPGSGNKCPATRAEDGTARTEAAPAKGARQPSQG